MRLVRIITRIYTFLLFVMKESIKTFLSKLIKMSSYYCIAETNTIYLEHLFKTHSNCIGNKNLRRNCFINQFNANNILFFTPIVIDITQFKYTNDIIT